MHSYAFVEHLLNFIQTRSGRPGTGYGPVAEAFKKTSHYNALLSEKLWRPM